MTRVKLDVLKPWINQRVASYLNGLEDDVVVEFVFNQLEDKNPDPRKMQINLTGFLNGKNARLFMGELWNMLDAAQTNPAGIPQELIDKKKDEIKSRRVILIEVFPSWHTLLITSQLCSLMPNSIVINWQSATTFSCGCSFLFVFSSRCARTC